MTVLCVTQQKDRIPLDALFAPHYVQQAVLIKNSFGMLGLI
jgi:hypothetical protein